MKIHPLKILSTLFAIWLGCLSSSDFSNHSLPDVTISTAPSDTIPGCGFDFFFEKMKAEHPTLFQQMEEQQYLYFSENQARVKNRMTFTIPVVYHIIHENGPENISDQRIQKSLEYLNDGFANSGHYFKQDGVDMNIRFCLAKRDPYGNATNGINRVNSPLTVVDQTEEDRAMKALSLWDPTCYVNIWVVKDILKYGQPSYVAGYAYLPFVHGRAYDGIVCEADWIGSHPDDETVLIHEMGHYLGLYHTFEGGCFNEDCLRDGDQVCDTPPDQYASPSFCSSGVNSCSTDTLSGFSSDQPDMLENFMDYSYASCQNTFTLGQKERMFYFLEHWRSSILECDSCLDPCPVETSLSLSANETRIGVGQAINIRAEVQNVDHIEWRIEDQIIGQGATLDYTFDAPGIYTVIAKGIVDNLSCQDELESMVISVYCPEDAQIIAETLEVIAGESLTFSGSALYGHAYEWSIDGAVVGNGTSLNHTFTGGGLQKVTFKSLGSDHCEASEASVYVNVLCPIEVSIQSEVSSGIVGQSYTFTAFSEDTEQFEWLINDQFIQSGSELNYLFEEDQVYQIALKGFYSNGGCSSEDLLNFEVSCDMDIDIRTTIDSIPVNQSFTFEADVRGASSLEWQLNGRVVGASPSFSNTFNEVGLQELTLMAFSDEMACAPLKKTMLVWVYCPIGNLTIIPNQETYLVGQNGSFSAAYGSVDNFEWLIDNVVVGTGPTLNFEFQSDGQKEIILKGAIDNASCEQLIDRLTIEVLCPLEGEILASETIINVGESIDFTSDYPLAESQEWYINENKVSVEKDFTWEFNEPGNFEVLIVSRYKDCYQSESVFVYVREYCQYEDEGNHYGLGFDGRNGQCNSYDFLDFGEIGQCGQWIEKTPSGDYYYLTAVSIIKLNAKMEIIWSADNGLYTKYAQYDSTDGGVLVMAYHKVTRQEQLIKYAATGEILWTFTIEEESNPKTFFNDLVRLPNGHFVLSVNVRKDAGSSAITMFANIVTLSSDGEIISELTVDNTHVHRITTTDDGGFLLLGFGPNLDHTFSLIKVCQAGNIEWSKIYGPRNVFINFPSVPLHEVENNDFLIAFNLFSSATEYDPHLMRINGRGEIQWTKKFIHRGEEVTEKMGGFAALPNGKEFIFSIAEDRYADAGNPIFYGKINTAGEILWGRTTTFPIKYFQDIFYLDEQEIAFVGQGETSSHLYFTDERGLAPGCNIENGSISIKEVNLASSDYPVKVVTDLQFKKVDIELETRNTQPTIWSNCTLAGTQSFDASIAVIDKNRCTGSFSLTLEICNFGNQDIPENTSLAAYLQNPTAFETEDINTFLTPRPIKAQQCDTISISLPFASLPHGDATEKLFLFFNDEGTSETPFDLSPGFAPSGQSECNFQNNGDSVLLSDAIPFPAPAIPFDIGPTDTLICPSTTLQIGIDPDAPYYDLRWENNSSAFQRNVTSPGTYSLIGYDECGQVYYDTIHVHPPKATPPLDLGPDQIVCNQQVFTFQAQGGFASYRWQDGSTEATFTAWEEGKYWVDATDVCGLVKTDTVEIRYDPATVFDLGPDTLICQGESVTLRGEIGFETYQWNPKKSISCTDCLETTVTPDTTTTYFLTAWNANGCMSTDTVRIEVGFPSEQFESRQICAGEQTSIFGQIETEAGLYSRTFQSSVGCDSLVQIQLEVVEGQNSTETISICTGESATIFGQIQTKAGSYTQSFNTDASCDSTHTIVLEVREPIIVREEIQLCAGQNVEIFGQQVNSPGTYEQTFTGSNTCDSTHQYVVSVQDQIQMQEEIVLCAGASVMVFGEPVHTAGIYTKSFNAESGCDSIHQIEVVLTDTIATSETIRICRGESIPIFGQDRSSAGEYQAVFSAANGCDSTHYVRLEVMETTITSEEITICAGETASIFGVPQSEAGFYSQSFTGSNNCDSTHQISLRVLPLITKQETLHACPGDSILVFGDFVYASGFFEQTFTSLNGCDSVHSVQVNFAVPISLEYELIDACAGQNNGQITLLTNEPPGYRYQWSGGQPSSSLTQLSSGIYQLTITDEQACTYLKSFEIQESSFPLYDLEWQDPSCSGGKDGQIIISPLEDKLQFGLNNGMPTSNILFDQLSEGNYQVQIYDDNKCVYEESVVLTDPEPPVFELPNLLEVPAGESIILPLQVDSLPDLSYEWSPTQGLSCSDCPNPIARPSQDITYQLTIWDQSNCSYELSLQLILGEAPALDLPNAFTPNADGINETFVIPGIEDFPKAELIVFNRWGQVVFSAKHYQNDWTGTNQRGKPLPEGTYYYLLQLDIAKEAPLTGHVTIIR
jgi:gliding motility-associated-like protein